MTDEKNEETTYFKRVYKDVYKCIKCGFNMGDLIYLYSLIGDIKYCPNCGRRIRDDS